MSQLQKGSMSSPSQMRPCHAAGPSRRVSVFQHRVAGWQLWLRQPLLLIQEPKLKLKLSLVGLRLKRSCHRRHYVLVFHIYLYTYICSVCMYIYICPLPGRTSPGASSVYYQTRIIACGHQHVSHNYYQLTLVRPVYAFTGDHTHPAGGSSDGVVVQTNIGPACFDAWQRASLCPIVPHHYYLPGLLANGDPSNRKLPLPINLHPPPKSPLSVTIPRALGRLFCPIKALPGPMEDLSLPVMADLLLLLPSTEHYSHRHGCQRPCCSTCSAAVPAAQSPGLLDSRSPFKAESQQQDPGSPWESIVLLCPFSGEQCRTPLSPVSSPNQTSTIRSLDLPGHQPRGNIKTMTLLSAQNLFLAGLAYLAWCVVYQLVYYRFAHPLAKFPGSFWASVTRLWITWHNIQEDECATYRSLHEKHGESLLLFFLSHYFLQE